MADTATATRSPAELARVAFDAVRAHDIDAILATWHPEGIQDWIVLGVYRGHEGIRGIFTEVFAAVPDFEVVPEKIVADDRHAVVTWRSSGTFDGEPFQGIDPTGSRVELRGVDVLEVEDGLIVRNTIYYDGQAFARQVGMMPPQDSGVEKAMVGAFNGVTRLRRIIRERSADA